MSEISENPWMVELHYTFHDNRYLFFVMVTRLNVAIKLTLQRSSFKEATFER